MRVYDGGSWIAASSAGGASLLEYNYTATAGQTTFSGSDDNSATLAYVASNLIVTLNGIVLENGTDYTATNGTSIVLTVAAAVDDELNVVAFKSFTTADMVPASTGGTFNGNVSVTGDLTVDTDTLVVDSTNNRVGINTTPAYKLDVSFAGVAGWGSRFSNTSSGSAQQTTMRFLRNGTSVGFISTTNTATQYVTSSDYRLKENAVAISDGITRLKQLQPKRFNFINDDSVVDGFMAHEAQAVVPEAVTGTQDAVDEDGNPDYQGIDQAKLVPLLTAALQEAIAKIETLETKVAALEAN